MKLNQDVNQKLRKMDEQQQRIARAVPKLPWLAALLLTLSTAAVMGTLYQVGQVASAAKLVHTQDTPNYSVSRAPLTDDELKELINWLRLRNPHVVFEVTKSNGLQVNLNDGRYHGEWLYALAALQSHGTDVVWDVSDFCVGRCSGPVAMAVVTGYKQKLEQN